MTQRRVPKVSFHMVSIGLLVVDGVNRYIIKTVSGQKVFEILSANPFTLWSVRSHTFVPLITTSRPEISNLLGFDITRGERRALQRGSRHLKDRERRSIGGERLCHPRDSGDERRKRKTFSERKEVRNGSKRILHLDCS